MVTSQPHTAAPNFPLPLYFLVLVVLIVSAGGSFLIAARLDHFPLLGRFGIWMLGPAGAFIVLGFFVTRLAEAAVGPLLLLGQAVGACAILMLIVSLF